MTIEPIILVSHSDLHTVQIPFFLPQLSLPLPLLLPFNPPPSIPSPFLHREWSLVDSISSPSTAALEEKIQRKKKGERKDEKKLEPDQVLKSERGTEYLVDRLLGTGGFGEVWKICLLKDPEKQFAMKTESNYIERKSLLRLKCEVNLFEEIERSSNQIDKTHFVKMYDKGKTRDFKYYVMDLIWLSIKDIKEKICVGSFTPHTRIKIARQTLKAIESLHEIGFLHRDIKPANFAVGLPPKEGTIFMLDFGIARPYKDKDGGVRKAHKRVPYMGTLLYASMEALAQNEQARRDDLEVWLYMILELYDKANLLWAFVEKDDLQLHLDLRMELMQKPRELFAAGRLKTPEKFCDIIELLNTMAYEEVGDFTQINLLLSQICVDENVDENLPVDWMGKKQKSPEKPKKDKKEKKKEARKKETAKAKEEEGKDHRLSRKQGKDEEDSGSDDPPGSDVKEEHSDDYEAYLKWKKKRREKKKASHERGSNEHSDRDQKAFPRKKISKKGEIAENEKEKDKKIPPVKKSGGEPEGGSNESNNEKRKKPMKKRATATPDSNEDEKDEKGYQPKRGVPRKRETNHKEKITDRKKPTKRKSHDLPEEKVEKKEGRKNEKPPGRNVVPELKRVEKKK